MIRHHAMRRALEAELVRESDARVAAEQEAADLRTDLATEQIITATLTAALAAPGTAVRRETAWSLRGAVGDALVARLAGADEDDEDEQEGGR